MFLAVLQILLHAVQHSYHVCVGGGRHVLLQWWETCFVQRSFDLLCLQRMQLLNAFDLQQAQILFTAMTQLVLQQSTYIRVY